MARITDQFENFYARNRQEWREWLARNHATSPGVWLVYFKKESGKPRVSYEHAVEEALCFGWIDSLPNKIDEQSYKQLFTPRKPKSTWSKVNKERVERLLADGLIMPAGLKAIEIAQQNGSWTVLDEVEMLTIPEDLALALAANPLAEGYFAAFSNSVKKGILGWISSAKRPETRAKRVEETVSKAARNVRVNFDRDA